MKVLKNRFFRLFSILNLTLITVFGLFFFTQPTKTYAEDRQAHDEVRFVTIHDQGKSLTIKTDAPTVKEAIDRSKIKIESTDIIEPSLEDPINSNNYHINIYRARPVIIMDGIIKKYLMSASYDPKIIAKSAGLSLYDGDQVDLVSNLDLLESGVASTYQIKRNGGQTITIETTIPFPEQIVYDYNLEDGKSELTQIGEDGTKITKYQVQFVDGIEVSRELISESTTKAPVNRITTKGAKKSVPPEWSTCASWARQAGVSESDLYIALTLIYKESGCRFDAQNRVSGAYGIPQALPGSKMASAGSDWQTNPITQIRWMIGYVAGRYGGWSQAWSFWQARGWY